MRISSAGRGFKADWRSADDCCGFTLVEIIIIMLIVGMMAAIISPAVRSGINSLRFRTAIRKLVANLRYCRSKAVSTKEKKEVEINMDKGSYRILGPKMTVDEEDGGAPVGELPDGAIFTEWETSYESDSSGIQIVTFFPKGNTTGGTLRIEDQNGRLFEIIIDRITGRVNVTRPDE